MAPHLECHSSDRITSLSTIIGEMAKKPFYGSNQFQLKGGRINVLDVTDIHQSDLPSLVNILLSRTFQVAVLRSQKKLNPKRPNTALVFDEGKLFKSSKSDPLSPLNRIATEGRKFGLMAIFGIQNPDQIDAEIRSSIGTTVVLPVANNLQLKVAKDYGLNKDQLRMLEPKKRICNHG